MIFFVNLTILFFLALFLSITIHGSSQKKMKYLYMGKPLLMPLVFIFYYVNAIEFQILLIAGLFFGWIGDILLIKPKGKRFLLGLCSFLIGHIFYIYILLFRIDFFSKLPWVYFLLLIPYQFLIIPLYLKIKKNLGKMKIPVLVYISVILIMSFSALVYVKTSRKVDFWLPFIGSLLFLFSDAILAIKEYGIPYKNSEAYLLISYVLAQLLIVMGLMS